MTDKKKREMQFDFITLPALLYTLFSVRIDVRDWVQALEWQYRKRIKDEIDLLFLLFLVYYGFAIAYILRNHETGKRAWWIVLCVMMVLLVVAVSCIYYIEPFR
ncbi:hypothetical protein LJC07_02870 [Christensenellaceae bacterium OttesenSCG-928-L17]|nr:hypothetical protein [Christensenellaceae bacterium OttesenSCG-928-L17]